MTSKKITVMCHHLGISMMYYDDYGHLGEWKKAHPQEMYDFVINEFLHHLNRVYCKELGRVVKKDGLLLSRNLVEGIDVTDGCWMTRTFVITIYPINELAEIRNEACKGPKTPDWKLCDRKAKALARNHWKERDRWPIEHIARNEKGDN